MRKHLFYFMAILVGISLWALLLLADARAYSPPKPTAAFEAFPLYVDYSCHGQDYTAVFFTPEAYVIWSSWVLGIVPASEVVRVFAQHQLRDNEGLARIGNALLRCESRLWGDQSYMDDEP